MSQRHARFILVLGVSTTLLLSMVPQSFAAKVKIRFAGRYVAGAHQKGWEAIDRAIKEYSKLHPEVKIEYIGVADHIAYREKLLTMGAAGQLPDIMNLYQSWIYEYASRNIISPIPADIANRVRDRYYPAAYRSMSYKGKLCGFATENQVTGLMYSKRVLAEAGMGSIPNTWDSLMGLAAKLTVRNANGTVKRQGFGAEVTSWSFPNFFRMWLAAYGGKFFDKDGEPAFVSREGLKLTSDLKDWYTGSRIASVDPLLVYADKGAFALAWPWYMISAGPRFKNKLDDSIGIAEVPAGPGGKVSFHYAWGYGLSSTSKCKKEALQFMEWLSTAPVATGAMSYVGATMAGLGSLPSVKGDAGRGEFATYPGWYGGFTKNLEYTLETETLPVQEQVELAIFDEISPVITGKRTPENALDNTRRKLKIILAKIKK